MQLTLPKPNLNLPQMDNCSVGLNAVLYTLSQLPRARKAKPFDTMLVNVSTMIRNCYNQQLPTDEVIKKVYADIDILVKHFANYSKIIRITRFPSIIFYIPSYSSIPSNMRRLSNNVANQNMDKILMLIAKDQKQHAEQHKLLGIDAHSVKVGNGKLPHQDILNYLRDTTPNGMRPESLNYLLLSHIPLDFHLASKIPITTIESYTGAQRAPNTFGSKVFSVGYIPFNKYTHAIFGDKISLKSQVTGKVKTALFKRAQDTYWMTKSIDDIVKDIRASNLLTSDKLLSVDV